jgi:hypothetical protein
MGADLTKLAKISQLQSRKHPPRRQALEVGPRAYSIYVLCAPTNLAEGRRKTKWRGSDVLLPRRSETSTRAHVLLFLVSVIALLLGRLGVTQRKEE